MGKTKVMYQRWMKTKPSHWKGPDLTALDGLDMSVGKENISKGELERGLSRVKDL